LTPNVALDPWIDAGAGLLLLALSAGCRSEPGDRIQLVLGPARADRIEFEPIAAFAEYLEPAAGAGRELRITLAGYEASCERFVPPPEGAASITVVAVAPPGSALGTGEYVWAGHEAHGGTPSRPERSYAAPAVRVGPKSFVLQPGGQLRLTEALLTPSGHVEGILAFEFSGTAEHPATAVKGSFRARICRHVGGDE